MLIIKCHLFKHVTEPDPINYGQNLHMSFSSHPKNTSDWANIINGKDGWFDEVDYMDCTNVVTFRYTFNCTIRFKSTIKLIRV